MFSWDKRVRFARRKVCKDEVPVFSSPRWIKTFDTAFLNYVEFFNLVLPKQNAISIMLLLFCARIKGLGQAVLLFGRLGEGELSDLHQRDNGLVVPCRFMIPPKGDKTDTQTRLWFGGT